MLQLAKELCSSAQQNENTGHWNKIGFEMESEEDSKASGLPPRLYKVQGLAAEVPKARHIVFSHPKVR
jgi:hypothetical protein